MRVKPNGKTLYASQVLFKEDDAIKRLKDGIDGLIGRISEKTQKENRTLKERLEYLEKENLRLCNILYGGYHQEKGDRNRR